MSIRSLLEHAASALALLTIYFTLRSAWYAFWWHMARTGRLVGARPPTP